MARRHFEGRPHDGARRHFLGLAAAAAARVAATGVAIAAVPHPASARGLGWLIDLLRGGHGPRPNCILKGARITTTSSERAIEELRIGDVVEISDGELAPVRWIGRQTFKRNGSKWLRRVAPVRICRSALDEDVPRRDLFLSPTHRLLIDGYLVQACDLLNGTSILQEQPEDETLEYFNVLLDRHEVLFAEGAPVASLQWSRHDPEQFANFVELERLYGRGAPIAEEACAPTLGVGGREHLKALVRIGASPFIRMEDPLAEIYDRIARRGEQLFPDRVVTPDPT